jgi:hypothetical protein
LDFLRSNYLRLLNKRTNLKMILIITILKLTKKKTLIKLNQSLKTAQWSSWNKIWETKSIRIIIMMKAYKQLLISKITKIAREEWKFSIQLKIRKWTREEVWRKWSNRLKIYKAKKNLKDNILKIMLKFKFHQIKSKIHKISKKIA